MSVSNLIFIKVSHSHDTEQVNTSKAKKELGLITPHLERG